MANFQNQPPFGMPFNPPLPFPIYSPQPLPPSHNESQTVAPYQPHATVASPTAGTMGANAPQFPSFWNHFQSGAFPRMPPQFLAPNGYPIPPPPFPPGFNLPAPQVNPTHNAPPAAYIPPLASHNSPLASTPIQQPVPTSDGKSRTSAIQVTDKEDGELSEGDISSPHVFARTRVAPRSVQTATTQAKGLPSSLKSTQADKLHSRPSDSLNMPALARVVEPPSKSPRTAPIPINSGKPVTLSRDDAKAFMQLLHRSHYNLADLAKENLNPAILSELWQDAGLPLNSPDLTQLHPVGPAPDQAARVLSNRSGPNSVPARAESVPGLNNAQLPGLKPIASGSSLPAAEFSGKTASSLELKSISQPAASAAQVRPPSSTDAVPDRSAYIARLMAARSNKAPGASKALPMQLDTAASTSPSQSPGIGNTPVQIDPTAPVQKSKAAEQIRKPSPMADPVPNTTVSAAAEPQVQLNASTEVPTMTDAERKKIQQNELIRQRIAMLQANKSNKPAPAPIAATRESRKDACDPACSNTEPRSESPLYEDDADRAERLVSEALSSRKSANGFAKTDAAANIPDTEISALFAESAGGNAAARRKRPVASDFDTAPTIADQSTFKRPFGRSRYSREDEEMIIEVSDDDTSPMDLDDDHEDPTYGEVSQPIITPPNYQTLPAGSVQHPSTHKSSTPSLPTSGVNTPAVIQDASYKRKEEEIQKLRKKIAEAEERKKAKGSSTRGMIPSTEPEPPSLPARIGGHTQGSDSVVDGSSLTEQSTPQPADWRQRRRAELQSGLEKKKSIEARNKARKEQLRREMELLEAEERREQEENERLAKELESLGVDTEGMPPEALHAAKDEILQQIGAERKGDSIQVPPPPTIEHTSAAEIFQSEDAPIDIDGDDEDDDDLYEVSPATTSAVQPVPERPMALDSTDPDGINNKASEESIAAQQLAEQLYAEALDEGEEEDSISGDNATEHATAYSTHVDNGRQERAVSPSVHSDASIQDDCEEDFYSPEPVETQVSEGKEAQPGLAEDESEEYLRDLSPVPDENDGGTDEEPMAISEASDYEPTGSFDGEHVTPREDEIDEYEPTNEIPVILSPKPAASESSDVSSSDMSDVESVANENQLSEADVLPDIVDEAQGLQSELQEASECTEGEPRLTASDAGPQRSRYQPYDSPLRMFKAYRYHPDYTTKVKGAYRSMTFSHNIDAQVPLCPFESSGGNCNDRDCNFQHFKKMELSDDMILVQLGTTNPGRTEAEKHQWTEGLRAVLKELRNKNTKDANIVSAAIASYRREFLKDPTKVLNL